MLKTKTLTAFQFSQIDDAWNNEYPIKLMDRFGILLDGSSDHLHYLIEDIDGQLIGWGVIFEKESEKRFSIIVKNEFKGLGYGKKIINEFKKDHSVFYGWVIGHDNDIKANGEQYISPLAFYKKLNCEVLQYERIESDMISAVKIVFK